MAIFHPSRGGNRGGKDQFKWDDVKDDKDRECYLGHSVMAPVGRWQKGKDLTWYAKGKDGDKEARHKEEIRRVKEQESLAMAAALGHAVLAKSTPSLSKEEMTEVLKRGVISRDTNDIERVTGMGYTGKKSRLPSDNKDSMFEVTHQQQPSNRNETLSHSPRTTSGHRSVKDVKKSSKKTKKDKKKKHRKRHSSSSDNHSDDDRRRTSRHHDKDDREDRRIKNDNHSDDDDNSPVRSRENESQRKGRSTNDDRRHMSRHHDKDDREDRRIKNDRHKEGQYEERRTHSSKHDHYRESHDRKKTDSTRKIDARRAKREPSLNSSDDEDRHAVNQSRKRHSDNKDRHREPKSKHRRY